MGRYLTKEQLKTNLSLGFTVEQWLGYYQQADYVIIRWLTIYKERDQKYTVVYFECFDEGNENFFDIYEFSSLDPDKPSGVRNRFDSGDEALNFSTSAYRTSNEKYVSAGMIQEEYGDYMHK